MHLHILGICGTFMGGLALLARELGFTVTGADQDVYPPMSRQLESAGIEVTEGYSADQLPTAPDWVVIGNALSRGNPAIEAVLDRGLPYISGPDWLARTVLAERWVIGVAGTHGKTTTASMLASILEGAGLSPGFLIGGVPNEFGYSARLGKTPFFIVEADEYDTAFFDKRSKFLHYHPRTLILNNLEFDHADIFPDLAAIQRQFHHLVRTVPGNGLLIRPSNDAALDEVLDQGCWTQVETISAAGDTAANWHFGRGSERAAGLEVVCDNSVTGKLDWDFVGEHNRSNALAALAAARHAGVTPVIGLEALNRFSGVQRRLQLLGEPGGVAVYDDFAHHPTAIHKTLVGLREKVGVESRLVAVLEPRSNSMRMGSHRQELASSLQEADRTLLFEPADINWSLTEVAAELTGRGEVFRDLELLISELATTSRPGDQIIIMSNGSFGGLHNRLLAALADSAAAGRLRS